MADLDWDEWNPSSGTFSDHIIAGSFAGVVEHLSLYPVDTIKTHIQSEVSSKVKLSPFNSIKITKELLKQGGSLRLYRGASTVVLASIPAHAGYFSAYEFIKEITGGNLPGHHPLAAGLSGIVATLFHDFVMTPMDVIKQRLQLGYYKGIGDCAKQIIVNEGLFSLYRSLPTTLVMNIPYSASLIATNESIKRILKPNGEYDLKVSLIAGSGGGLVAAAITTPLDLIKTRLQTQRLGPLTNLGKSTNNKTNIPFTSNKIPPLPNGSIMQMGFRTLGAPGESNIIYRGIFDAIRSIYLTQGIRGFFLGLFPRIIQHTPAAALSWTMYETCKSWLKNSNN